jgi:signal peptidase I
MDDRDLSTPPTAAAAELPLQPPPPPKAAPAGEEAISAGKGVKETVESILIAFILAFVFRAFVVEAFVIPTGSMATTLLGAHMRFTCRECGYDFDTNYPSASSNSDDIEIPTRSGPTLDWVTDPETGERRQKAVDRKFDVVCPNCRFAFTATNPYVRYGDRILVLKYLYIPWVSPRGPGRWDVVVFKNPTDRPTFQQNYIKRLTGLPDEWVMLLDGDVYVCRDGAYKDVDRRRASEQIPPDKWEIQSKPPHAQEALWRLVYDHDFRPLDRDRGDDWRLPWVAEGADSGWRTGAEPGAAPVEALSRVLAFNNPTGKGELRFDPKLTPGYNKDAAPGGYFTDWLAYDVTMMGSRYPVYTVSDLKLAFTYERRAGDGPLTARLTKYDHQFSLRLDPGRVTLTHRAPGEREGAEVPPVRAFDPSRARGPVRVEFENADYRVRVRLNGEVVFETTPEQYRPNVRDLLARYRTRDVPVPTVRIEAERQESALSHVSLWRDVYYTPENQDRSEILHGSPRNPIKLGADEYFVMGDNSAGSYDGRYWPHPVELPDEALHAEAGRVPGRFMLGRAFFVYWPAGYRPLNTAPALVPNFGDMRLIR